MERLGIPQEPPKSSSGSSLFNDMPPDPGLIEQAKELLAQMILDPSNVGMPGVGLTYRGAKQSVDKMLREAAKGRFKNTEQALLERNPADTLHPDALYRAQDLSLDPGYQAAGYIRHYSGNEPKYVDPQSPLVARGGRKGTFSLRINPFSVDSNINKPINPGYAKSVIDHEVGHANHMYGGEIPMPAYDAVLHKNPAAEKVVNRFNESIMEGIGNDPQSLGSQNFMKYFTSNPNELIAQLHAVAKTEPELVKFLSARSKLDPQQYQDMISTTIPILSQGRLNLSPKLPDSRRIISEIMGEKFPQSIVVKRTQQYPPGFKHVDRTGTQPEIWKPPTIHSIPYPGAFSESDLARRLGVYEGGDVQHGFLTPKGKPTLLGGDMTHRGGMDELLGYQSPRAMEGNRYVNDLFYENPVNKGHTYDLPEMMHDTQLTRLYKGSPRVQQRSYVDFPGNITDEQIDALMRNFGTPRDSAASLAPPDEIMNALRLENPRSYDRYFKDDLWNQRQPLNKVIEDILGNYAQDLGKYIR